MAKIEQKSDITMSFITINTGSKKNNDNLTFQRWITHTKDFTWGQLTSPRNIYKINISKMEHRTTEGPRTNDGVPKVGMDKRRSGNLT